MYSWGCRWSNVSHDTRCTLARALTLLQPDTLPDPDKAGAKWDDYWTPLKKRLPSHCLIYTANNVTHATGLLTLILCAALCS